MGKDKILEKYIHILCYSSSKRLRKKAWVMAQEIVTDKEDGMINYAKLAILIDKRKNHKKFISKEEILNKRIKKRSKYNES